MDSGWLDEQQREWSQQVKVKTASNFLHRTIQLSSRNRRRGPTTHPLIMSVTLHTNLGDIKMEVFCDTAERTAFNFLALCASGYYNGTSFHRNIKGFAIQGGDPAGTGKGGESIWGECLGTHKI